MTDQQVTEAGIDEFYAAKFDAGQVRAGWDYVRWTLGRVDDLPKTSTLNCHTTGRR